MLADEEAADTVGAVMDPGGVAAERDIVGQLVDLVAEGETGGPPGVQRVIRTTAHGGRDPLKRGSRSNRRV